MYDYDRRTALDLGVEAERWQRLLEEIRTKALEARKMAAKAKRAAPDRIGWDQWNENLKGFDRILIELDGM